MLLDYFVCFVHLLVGCAFDPHPPMEEGNKNIQFFFLKKRCKSHDIKHKTLV